MQARSTSPVKSEPFLVILLLFYFMIGSISGTIGQGWGFTFQVTQSGPCGASIPSLPSFSIPSVIPTKGQCEGLRQSILAIKVSTPMYDNKGKYIGDCAVFYTCTPCSGSDVIVPGQVSPGQVTLDGQFVGEPFYSPHESSAFEDWATNYKQQLESFGISSLVDKAINGYQVPLTGNKEFDTFYSSQTAGFNPTTEPVKPANDDAKVVHLNSETSGTVQLLTTEAEQAKRDKWYKDKGFEDLVPVSAENGIEQNEPPQHDFKENLLRTAVENVPGAGTIGSGLLNAVDAVFGEDGLPKVVTQVTRLDYEGAAQNAGNMTEGIRKSVANTMIQTIVNSFVEPVKGLGTSKLISAFGVGAKGETAINVVTTGVDLYQSYKEKK